MAFSITDIPHTTWIVSYALFSLLSLERVMSIYLSLIDGGYKDAVFFLGDRLIVGLFKYFRPVRKNKNNKRIDTSLQFANLIASDILGQLCDPWSRAAFGRGCRLCLPEKYVLKLHPGQWTNVELHYQLDLPLRYFLCLLSSRYPLLWSFIQGCPYGRLQDLLQGLYEETQHPHSCL